MQLLHLTTSLLLLRLVHSIEVTPNSKCFSVCANDISSGSNIADGKNSWTLGRDVVCEDYQLAGPNSTVQGRKWKECLTCELNSTAVDSPSKENELYWVLCKLLVSPGDLGSMARRIHNWYKLLNFLQSTWSFPLTGVFLHIQKTPTSPLPGMRAQKPARGQTIMPKLR